LEDQRLLKRIPEYCPAGKRRLKTLFDERTPEQITLKWPKFMLEYGDEN
jgi:hypothetical protein